MTIYNFSIEAQFTESKSYLVLYDAMTKKTYFYYVQPYRTWLSTVTYVLFTATKDQLYVTDILILFTVVQPQIVYMSILFPALWCKCKIIAKIKS